MSPEEIHSHALELPEDQRAKLAGDLLASLPTVLHDEDDGIAEARRRSKELDDNPEMGISWDQLKAELGR